MDVGICEDVLKPITDDVGIKLQLGTLSAAKSGLGVGKKARA